MHVGLNSNSSGGIDKEGEDELGGNGEKLRPNSISVNSNIESGGN